jgi:hypothetical protein
MFILDYVEMTVGDFSKKKRDYEIRTVVSGAWAGSPCSRPAFLQLV